MFSQESIILENSGPIWAVADESYLQSERGALVKGRSRRSFGREKPKHIYIEKATTMQTVRTLFAAALIGAVSIGFNESALAQDVSVDTNKVTLGKAEYSPYLDQGYPDRVYFGDTHLHTSYSTDAGMLGNRLGPEEAYRFARGEEVTSSTGVRARLQRPLDFLVVADHSENLGLAPMIAESNPELLKTEFGRKLHDMVKGGKGGEAFNTWSAAMISRQDPLKGNEAITRSMWERETTAAEKTSRGCSPPSSVSSGRPPRTGTTCTAT